MKKILPLILALILAACAPQVTVTSEVTVTLTPTATATVIPTPTLNPQFIALQEFVAAAGQRFTLRADGAVEDTTQTGTVVPGLSGADGAWTLQVGDELVKLDPKDVSFSDEDGVSAAGYIFNENKGEWVTAKVFTPEELAGMTPEQILAAAPENPDGLTKGGLSTIEGMDNLVKFYDAQGNLAQVYDLTKGEFETPEQAGIVEFPMTDGGKYEMKAFDTVEEILQEMIVTDGATYGMGVSNSIPNIEAFNARRRQIIGSGPIADGGYIIKVELGGGLQYGVFNLNGGTGFKYVSDENEPRFIYLRNIRASVGFDIASGIYPIPPARQ